MANALMVEGRLYDWLMQRNFTSDEHAHALATLLKRSGIVVPDNMKRDGKLINFFEDRPHLFGIVKGSDEAGNRRIYAIPREREGNRGHGPPRGRGGPHRIGPGRVHSQEVQELLDAQEQELLDAQMLNDAIRPNLPLDYPPELGLNDTNPLMLRNAVYDARKLASEKNQQSPFDYPNSFSYGGKKSKSKYRSARKSRSKKNRNRRNKTANKYRKSKSHIN